MLYKANTSANKIRTQATAKEGLVRGQLDNCGAFNQPCLLNCISGHSVSILKQLQRCNHLTVRSQKGWGGSRGLVAGWAEQGLCFQKRGSRCWGITE